MDFCYYDEPEEMRGYTIKISGMVQNELPKNMKQASIKDSF